MYIGLKSTGSGWSWVDGVAFLYNNLDPANSTPINESCVGINKAAKDLLWNSVDCAVQAPSVCEVVI